ncbi:hypothetical protein [Halorubrum sp. 48-1-W]|uniref:hypothetical protein n=1 Tax=Halorubrum sp. 48-1-W TaxID=2249761 RepID=UPI000FCC6527|nr:hypothetical protein [Halorubrum sp. 48-1-W]
MNTQNRSKWKENTGKENTGKENTRKENTGKENTGKENKSTSCGVNGVRHVSKGNLDEYG